MVLRFINGTAYNWEQCRSTITLIKAISLSITKKIFQSDERWSVILDPVDESEICDVTVTQQGSDDVIIQDVLFGDVWICSGQSNMEWPMDKIFDAEQEIAEMADFNIRLDVNIYELLN